MAEPPRDSLAEHPLGASTPRRKSGARTLDLFPNVGETPLTRPEPQAAPGSAPAGTADRQAAVPPSPQTPASEVEDPGEPLSEPLGNSPATDAVAPSVAFARRVAAGLADLLILALVGAVELAAGALLLELRFPPAALVGLGAFLFLAALVLLVLAPFVWGTTPGMALADLRIHADDGGSPTLAASFLRFLGFLLTGALAGVPLLLAAFDRRGRTLADLLSGTTLAPADRAPAEDEASV
jgi:uncharacterized RDD family membrane protein YckC